MPDPLTIATETGVAVALDSDRQVSAISIDALPDQLRTPEGLSTALHRAYLDALTERLDQRLGGPRTPTGQRPVADATRTPAPPRRDDFGHLDDGALTEFWKRPVPEPREIGRREVGVSQNRCVSAVLRTTDHFADLDIDPGWLRTARVSAVATAVLEAFEDAYTQRNER